MNQKQVKSIRRWVSDHRDDIIKDISELVNIPSVSNPQDNPEAPFGNPCKKALDTIVKLGTEYGLQAKNVSESCCQLWMDAENPQTQETVGIWGHLDVVPEDAAWHFPPFQATYKDGYLIGRGVGDNKGPCIGILYALRCLRELGYELPYSIALCYGTSEENGMMDVEEWLKSHTAPNYNLVADCGFPLCYGEMGRLDVSFTVLKKDDFSEMEIFAGCVTNMIPDYASCKMDHRQHLIEGYGVSTHVATPKDSVNAIANLCEKVLHKDNSLTERQKRLWEFLEIVTRDGYGRAANIAMEDTVSGALVGTVTWIRSDDEKIEMRADYRYPIFHNGEISDGTELIQNLNALAEKYQVKIEIRKNSRPSYFPKEHPFVQSLLKSYRQYTKSSTKPFVMSGGSYARMLPNAVAFGISAEDKKIYHEAGWPPGMGDYHQADESVYVDEILEAIVIYCKALVELKLTA